MEYVKLDGQRCRDEYGEFVNVSFAKESCKGDVQCKGVWDAGCDDSLNNVYLCFVGIDYEDSSSNCVYDKKGIPELSLRKKSHLWIKEFPSNAIISTAYNLLFFVFSLNWRIYDWSFLVYPFYTYM